MSGSLDVPAMLADAEAATALDDFGDEWFLTPLAAWSTDLQQANLTDFGRQFLRRQAVRDLSRRLQVLDTLKANPEIGDVDLPPIVHITGMERSGTTLMHNLLAMSAGARTLLRWELIEPIPPPEAETATHDPRIERVQAAVEPLRGSMLEHMHWVNADEPEECVWGFIDCVSFLGQAAGACMPTWGEFVQHADQTRAFEHYRQLIQLLTWKHPAPEGGFLVLKAPQIAVHVEAFASVFPEARFVVPDRDPFRCIVSVGVLARSIVDPFCIENPLNGDSSPPHLPGTDDLLTNASRKFDALMEFEQTHPDRVVHVPYPDLVDDASATVTGVATTLGLPADEGLASHIESFLAAQREGKRAAAPTELDTLGFDHDTVLASPSIDRYCRAHHIRPERNRLTGTH